MEKGWRDGNGSAQNPIQENHNEPEKPPGFLHRSRAVPRSQISSFLQCNVCFKELILESKELPPALPKPGPRAGSAQLKTRQQPRTKQGGRGPGPSRAGRIAAHSASASGMMGLGFSRPNSSAIFGLSPKKTAGLQGGQQRTPHPHLLLPWLHRGEKKKKHRGPHTSHLPQASPTWKDCPGQLPLPGSL